MTRRTKLRQIRKLRAFRDFILKKQDREEVQRRMIGMGAREITIQHNFSIYVNINMDDNSHFFVKAFWVDDALCEAGLKIYEHLLGKIYPTCVKIV
jgi:hypothetical protein